MSPPLPEVSVEFSVEDGLAAAWDDGRIRALVQSIVAGEFSADSSFSIALHLVSDESIRALNAEHRGKDSATDVLSFPLHVRDELPFVTPPGQPTHLGDVVISLPRATEQAHEYGHSVERELGYLVAHGVLHVLGYDHEKEADQRLMREHEEEALGPLGFTR